MARRAFAARCWSSALTALLLAAAVNANSASTDTETLQDALQQGNRPLVSEWFAQHRTVAESDQADALIAATRLDDPWFLDRLLASGIPVDARTGDDYRATALMYAAYENRLSAVQRLRKAGADIDARDAYGDTAMNWASYAGRAEAVSWLLAEGARADLVGHGNALQIAMRRGHQPVVLLLCAQQGCSRNATEQGRKLSSLIDSGRAGDWDPRQLRHLLASGETAQDGRPFLHQAARGNHLEWTKALLEAGADAASEDSIGFTALMEAAREGHLDTCKQLLAAGGRLDHIAKDSALRLTPLHMAAIGGHVEVIDWMLAQGAAIDTRDAMGNTPLLWALFEGKSEAANRLLEHGANTGLRNRDGIAAVDILDRK